LALSRVRFPLRFSSGGGFGASSGSGCRSILSLRLGKGGGLSGELCFSFARFVRFALSFSIAIRRDVCPRLGGSCAFELSSSWLMMAAPDCIFPCQHRSDSGRRSFNILGMSWMAHGVDCCNDSNVWSCASIMVGGLLPGVIAHCFSGLARQCGGWWRSLVKIGGPWLCFLCNLYNLQGLSCKKGLYCAWYNINPFPFAKKRE
jgi:hypothetical protein